MLSDSQEAYIQRRLPFSATRVRPSLPAISNLSCTEWFQEVSLRKRFPTTPPSNPMVRAMWFPFALA